MTNFKDKIRNSFNRASNSYDDNAFIQKQTAGRLVQELVKKDFAVPKKILDLGAGTGYMVELLLNIFPNAQYELNDISSNMLAICRSKFRNNNINFSNQDMKNLKIADKDLITSNLALQWVDNLWQLILYFYDNSKIFAFTTLLEGTFEEWQAIVSSYDKTISVNSYPTYEQITHYCNSIKNTSQLYYWQESFSINFDNSFEFARYLKNIGASTIESKMLVKDLRFLFKSNNCGFTTNYEVFFAIFIKN